MTLSTLKIGRREFVVVARKDFDRLQRQARMAADIDSLDGAESIRRLKDPKERRIPWEQVKKHAGLA